MVDYFALALSHGLLAFAAWRLLWRDDLDRDPEPTDAAQSEQAAERPAKPGLRIRA